MVSLILKKIRMLFIIVVCILSMLPCSVLCYAFDEDKTRVNDNNDEEDYIKWIDFNIPVSVLERAYKHDLESWEGNVPVNWVELLAYTSAKNWGNMKDTVKACKDMDELVEKLNSGESISVITENLKLYSYYLQIYNAILENFVGEYEIENKDENGKIIFEKKYGLKVFSPIAKGYYYNHYDDFGDGRTYGYKRKHLGNDLMGSVGTPIIAVEGGYVEALGWNKFGGWRVGIRSFDKKRYYYYAHLRKDHPYHQSLKPGKLVQAGDVIGYLGMTGYSNNENANNIKIPHLHFGLQIIFDEAQKDGANQIWIDLYNLVEFLDQNKMKVYKDPQTKEFEAAVKINTIYTD